MTEGIGKPSKVTSRNPHTGIGVILDARRVVIFKCSDVLRDKINGKVQGLFG